MKRREISCLTDVNTCSMSMCVMSGHSMAETLTVALRVAEEAIEEAITKAEEFSDSLVRRLLLSFSSFLSLRSMPQAFTSHLLPLPLLSESVGWR